MGHEVKFTGLGHHPQSCDYCGLLTPTYSAFANGSGNTDDILLTDQGILSSDGIMAMQCLYPSLNQNQGDCGYSLERESGTLPILPRGDAFHSHCSHCKTTHRSPQTKPTTLFQPLFATKGLTGQLPRWPATSVECKYFLKGFDLPILLCKTRLFHYKRSKRSFTPLEQATCDLIDLD